MSILIWGRRTKRIDLGMSEVAPCTVCEQDRTFRTVLQYQLNHLYYILGFVSNKQAYRLCDVCGRGYALNTAVVEASLGKSRIPVLERFGCLGALGGIVGLVLLGVLFATFSKPPRNIPDLIERAGRGDSSAYTRLREEAAADDVPSQEALVQLLAASQNPAEKAEAFRWALQASEHGSAWAQHEVAGMYLDGRGTTADPGQAAHWYRAAESQGNAMSANSLGALYFQGLGVAADPQEAIRLFRKAADAGDPAGAYNLGMRYLEGVGVDPDPATAAQWLEKAAAGKDPIQEKVAAAAKLELARLYEDGKGVERDALKAIHLYEEASSTNDEARQNLDRLKARLAKP
jgi:TPR repeat protein